MSQAFVRERDDEWLEDVDPTINALINFLTRENNGVRVYEQKITTDLDMAGRKIHWMSNGLQYAHDSRGRWEVVK